jgi:hypothetical protein
VYTVRASPEFHWKLASTPLLDEAIHKSGVIVVVGTPNLCTIQRFSGDTGKQKRLLLVGYLHLLLTDLLLLIGWLHYLWALHDSSMLKRFDIFSLCMVREKL